MVTESMIPVINPGVAHPGDAALTADIGGNALQGHHGDRPGILRDLGLFGGDHVHDHAALQHLRQAGFDLPGTAPVVQ